MDSLAQRSPIGTTRRTIVKTGAKLLYAAPALAASYQLTELAASAEESVGCSPMVPCLCDGTYPFRRHFLEIGAPGEPFEDVFIRFLGDGGGGFGDQVERFCGVRNSVCPCRDAGTDPPFGPHLCTLIGDIVRCEVQIKTLNCACVGEP